MLAGLLAGTAIAADIVRVLDPWARASVPGQKVAGIYMELIPRESLRLTGVKSPAAETAQVHQMKLENGIMRMRGLPFLDLPAGRAVKLRPGGYHVMLFDLRHSLVPGQKVKLELTFEDRAKRLHQVPIEAVVRDRDGARASEPDHP